MTKSLRALFGTLVLGFAICPVQAENIVYDYTGTIYSGPGTGGSLFGQFGYDPAKITSARTGCGTGSTEFGTYCYSIYEFSSGGMNATYSGALGGQIDALEDGTNFIEVIDGSLRDHLRFNLTGPGGYRFTYNIATTDTSWLNGTDIPAFFFVPDGMEPSYRSWVEETSSACGQETCYSYFTPANSAGRSWLLVRETYNVPIEDMLAACDRVTGKCTGSVTTQWGVLDLSGYVWASRMEAINYIFGQTAIPIDLTGTVYRDGELWLLECDSQARECPPEHGIWFDFVGDNLTREGGSSFSFQGIYRDTDYYLSPGESYASTLFGYNMGEGLSIFADSGVWIERGQSCTGEMDEDACWDAYGYFLYKPTPQPAGLASISLSKTTIAGCKSVTGYVTLTAPAPDGGLTVTLSDTLSAATVPVSVTIPAGSTKKKFTVKTIPVSAAEIGTVNATLDGRTVSKDLTIRPIGVYSVSLYPTKVVGGSNVAGTVKLECNAPAPAGITVDLASTFAAVANPVAASITVPAGYKSWLFDVATYPVLSNISAKISGTANGITKSGSLTVTPAASVSATKLAFGNQVVGTTSGPKFVTLYNKGTLAFSVDSIVITGTYTSWFAFTHDCPASLAAGAACTIGVTFTPKAAASKSATLRIATSATSSRLTVTLTGTGVTPP